MNPPKRILPALLLALTGAAGCQTGGDSRVVERLDVDMAALEKPAAQLRLIGGPVEIIQSPDNLLVVEMLAGRKDPTLPVALQGLVATRAGGGVDIDIGTKYMGNAVRIHVPSGALLMIQSADSEVRAADVDCDLWINLQNGRVKVERLTGQFKARTVGGQISASFRALRADPAIEVETVDGPIAIALPIDASSDVHARLLGGSLAMKHPHGKRVSDQSNAVRDVPGKLLLHDERWRIGSGGRTIRISSTGGSARLDSTR